MRTLAVFLSSLSLVTGACTDDAIDPPIDPVSKLELRMEAVIPAGAEVEYCQFVTVPETWVTKDAVDFTAGSHHVLVYQTPYTAIPTHKNDGTSVDTSGVFDCSDGATNGWSVTKLVGGSQNRDGDSLLAFPEGVGTRIGGVMLINVHYRNGSDAPLAADTRIAFDTTTADRIVHEGDLLFLYNPLRRADDRYLKLTGRSDEQVRLVETYARQAGLWADRLRDAQYERMLSFDLSTVVRNMAGPSNPHARLPTTDLAARGIAGRWTESPGQMPDGAVIIAAITSCTNTSNPRNVIAAGLLARNANRLGLVRKPWVKTSLAPGSRAVALYLEEAGLLTELERLGFGIVGFACTTCNGMSGALDPKIQQDIIDRDLSATRAWR